jgi:hypothetical protein
MKDESIEEDWPVLASLFPPDWRGMAVKSGATKGLRKCKSEEDLLRTLLIHLGCGYSLRETVVRARESGLADLSDVALMKRLRKSRDWLHQLCVGLFDQRGVKADPGQCRELRLFDATSVREPGKTGSLWRIHYSVRFPSLQCDHFRITANEGVGTGESLSQFPIAKGDLIMVDRGYCNFGGIEYADSKGGRLTVRVAPHNIRILEHSASRAFPVLKRLSRLRRAGEVGSWKVLVSSRNEDSAVRGRLCAVRKSREAIERAHKKIRRLASKNGSEIKPETLRFAEYVILFTTFPEEEFSAYEVMEHYRVRWQVELVFKRFKQVAQLGHLPKQDEESAKAWLYGKLFVALLTERLMEYAESFSPWGYDLAQTATQESVA